MDGILEECDNFIKVYEYISIGCLFILKEDFKGKGDIDRKVLK